MEYYQGYQEPDYSGTEYYNRDNEPGYSGMEYYRKTTDQRYGDTGFTDRMELRMGMVRTKRIVALVILVLCILVGIIGLASSIIEENQRVAILSEAIPVEAQVTRVDLAPNPYTGEEVEFSAYDLVYVTYEIGNERFENNLMGKFVHKTYHTGRIVDILIAHSDHGQILEQETDETRTKREADRKLYTTIILAGGIPVLLYIVFGKLLKMTK